MSYCVLIIEDDADVAEMLALALRDEGYEAPICRDSSQALAMACALHPDVILLDLMMTPISGEDIVPRLRGNPATAHIPIILESASHRMEERRIALGLCYAIAKPLDLDAMLRSVAGVLTAHAAT